MSDQLRDAGQVAVSLPGGNGVSYEARLAAEESTYRDCVGVHNLPDIFHYWSNRYVRPKLETFGFSGPNDMFRKYIEQCLRRHPGPQRFVSIGSGNCDLEVQLASQAAAAGYHDFVIDCLDLNTAMLERGRVAAAQAEVAAQMTFALMDVNDWDPAYEYDAVIANQALHHVLKLEELFARIKSCLKPPGYFIISDMIGRNGHQRWPEALDIVREFWRKLPPSYRFNRKLQRYEELFEDFDCSGEGFEGIRSQDILPLLLENFHFHLFIGFGNVIDPFVDRSFGFNFDAAAAWDRSFIDEVHQRDEAEISSGHLKPTHMLAAVGNNPIASMIVQTPITPEFCVRRPSAVHTRAHGASNGSTDAYDWHAWPHDPQSELEIAYRRVKESQDRIRQLTAHSQELDEQIEQRTAWALQLEKDLEERTAWALQLQKECEERTAWAFQMEKEFAERTAWALQLDREQNQLIHELEQRTAWALRLDQELENRKMQVLRFTTDLERLAWAQALDRRFHNFLDSGFRMACKTRARINRLLSGIRSH